MAGLLELMSNFMGGSNQQQPQPGAVTNPAIPGAASANKSDGSVPGIPAAPQGPADPLANYAELWKIDDKQKAGPPSLTPNLALDPNKLAEIAAKMDFTQGLPPELVQKAASGDGASMIQIMNQMSQSAFMRGLQAASQMTTNAFDKHGEVLLNHTIPQSVTAINSRSEVSGINKVLSNPAVAPMVEMVRAQVTQQNPNASPAEIASHVNNLFTGMSAEFLKASGVNVDMNSKTGASGNGLAAQNPSKVDDWVNWFQGPDQK